MRDWGKSRLKNMNDKKGKDKYVYKRKNYRNNDRLYY